MIRPQVRLANDQGGDGHHGCRLPTDPEQDRQPENEHPGEWTEEGIGAPAARRLANVCRRRRLRVRVRALRELGEWMRPSGRSRMTRLRSARYRSPTISRSTVAGSGSWDSIDHGACLVTGVGAIGVEVEYRTGGNGAPVR